jgi:hypothetical protein
MKWELSRTRVLEPDTLEEKKTNAVKNRRKG